MERENSQPTTYCHSCGRHILTSNFLIHEGRCQRMSQLRSSRVSQNPQKQKPSFDDKPEKQSIFQPRRQPYSFAKTNIRQKIAVDKKTPENSETEQRIPCPFCGYGQTLAQLDTHPNKCEHRQVECNFCRIKYPRSLMDDHVYICQKNPINVQRNSRSRNRMRRRQEQFGSDEEESQPMIFNERNRNMYNPSPLMDIFSHPFFRGSPFDNIHQSRGGPTYQVIRFSSNGGPNLIVRSNSANPSTFIQLIEMLARRANPNENPGLNQQELSRLPRVKYHKKNEEPDLCTICYVEFQENQEIIQLSCKHMYHQQCIYQWLKRVSTCPVCKKKLKQGRHQNEQFEEDLNEYPQHRNRAPNYPNGNNDRRQNQGGGGFFNFFGL